MSFFYSDDPVMDAHRHDAMQCREQERHHICQCAECGEDLFDYDEYYDFGDGDRVHGDCVIAWIAQYKHN